jgi:hypothetical protein
MSLNVGRIHDIVIEQLSRSEMRLLSLVVAVRKSVAVSGGYKGDLPASVKSVLRSLTASRMVVDEEGVYSLAKHDTASAGAPSKK